MVLKNEKNLNLRVIPREPGVFSREQLQAVYEVAMNIGTGVIRQVLDLPLSVVVPPEHGEEATKKLTDAGLLIVPDGNCVKDVKVCPECDHGNGNYREMGRRLNQEVMGKETPAHIRISLSGCGCRCAMAPLQDIGLIAGPKGYSMYIGGNPYGNPVIGQKIADNLSEDQVIPAIEKVLSAFETYKGKYKYLHQVVKAEGIEPFTA